MSTGCAKRIFCLGYFQGTMKDENGLHKKFGNLRMRSEGEWFLPSQELIDYIISFHTYDHFEMGDVIRSEKVPK